MLTSLFRISIVARKRSSLTDLSPPNPVPDPVAGDDDPDDGDDDDDDDDDDATTTTLREG